MHAFWSRLYEYVTSYPDDFQYMDQFSHSPLIHQVDTQSLEVPYQAFHQALQAGIEQGIIKNIPKPMLLSFILAPVVFLARSRLGVSADSTHWSPEIYDMLEDGRLDGIYVNIDSAYNLKLHQKAPYVLVSKNMWLGHLYVVAMNKTAYDALAQNDKDAIKRAASRAYRQQGRNMDEQFDAMVSKLRAEGAEIRMMTDEEVDQWGNLTNYPAIQRRWAQEQSKAGVQNAEDVIYKVTRVKRAF